MSVMTNPSDPFFTSLQAGAYDQKKPGGKPCDAVFNCRPGHHISKSAQIAIGVIVTIAGLAVFGLLGYCIWLMRKRRNSKF
jgi:endoglucanase